MQIARQFVSKKIAIGSAAVAVSTASFISAGKYSTSLSSKSSQQNDNKSAFRLPKLNAFTSILSHVKPTIESRFKLPVAHAAIDTENLDYFLNTEEKLEATYSTLGVQKKHKKPLQHGGLGPLDWTQLEVSEITPMSHDTNLFYFKLDTDETFLDFPVSSFVYVRVNVNGNMVVRPYFPLGNTQGELALMVKHYPDGPMSSVFFDLEVGDTLEFQGPIKKWDYTPNRYDRLTLIAGGTGITPMFQLIDGILNNPQDETKVHLIYANKTVDDILMKEILDDLAHTFPHQVKVTYTVETPSAEWSGPVGRVDEALLIAVAGEANPQHLVLVCGPDGMIEHVAGAKDRTAQGPIGGILRSLGYDSNDVFKF